MDDAGLVKILSNLGGVGAVSGALILILWKVLSRVADRSIAALDRIAVTIDTNATKSYEHHTSVRETMIKIHGDMSAGMASLSTAMIAQGQTLAAIVERLDRIDRRTATTSRGRATVPE